MIKYIQRRMILESKWSYLESLQSLSPVQDPFNQCSLGSWVKDCPILISSASSKYSLNDLELYLQTFFHNCLYVNGEGIHHQVKKCKLLKLDNSQVTII